ncbi:MAG TPA: DUF5362 family protein [Chitinophagaceae bacterium]
MEQNTSNLFELHLDQQSTSYLSEAARWGKFLSIVGFIMCALIVLVGIFAGSIMATAFGSMSGGDAAGLTGGMGVGMAIVYVLLALLYFFPCLYLYRFATRMQVALRSNDQQNLTVSFMNLKACFKFVGILTIIILAIYALVLIFAVLGATMASFG